MDSAVKPEKGVNELKINQLTYVVVVGLIIYLFTNST